MAAGEHVSRAVATPRHLAVLKEVGRACELSDVQHVVEPSAILEDPNGSGIKIELDMLMRDSAGMLIGVDTTVGTWDKESTRVQHVRAKMYGTGTMGARQVAQARIRSGSERKPSTVLQRSGLDATRSTAGRSRHASQEPTMADVSGFSTT